MTERYELSKDPAYQLSKDEKGCRIRVDGRGHYFATKDDKILYTSTMEITGQEILCTVREADGSTSVIVGKNPEAEPLEGIAETEIQVYNNSELKQNIGESLFYTNDKGQTEPTSLAAVLRDCIKDKLAKKNGKNPSMNEILRAVNQLKQGTLEEQAIYGMFRAHLVENGFMPIDENGRPYDLSLMFIPGFDPGAIMDCPDVQLRNEAITYYQINRAETAKFDQEDFVRCMNSMKTVLPERFVRLHNYLADAGIIPAESPIRTELDLTAEHIDYLRHLEIPAVEAAFHYFNNVISETIREKTGKTLVFWNIREQSPEWIAKYAPRINQTLAKMRFGDVDDQKAYHDFCVAISDLQKIKIAEEEPTYPEEARSMFARAQAKQARATIETKL